MYKRQVRGLATPGGSFGREFGRAYFVSDPPEKWKIRFLVVFLRFGCFSLLLASRTLKIESGIIDLPGNFWFPALGDRSQPHSCKIHHFTSVFTHFCDPNSLRIGPSLNLAHIHHSQLSSIAIGPLYLQHAPPTSLSQISSKFSPGIASPYTKPIPSKPFSHVSV